MEASEAVALRMLAVPFVRSLVAAVGREGELAGAGDAAAGGEAHGDAEHHGDRAESAITFAASVPGAHAAEIDEVDLLLAARGGARSPPHRAGW